MKEWDVGAFLARHVGTYMGGLTRIAIDSPEPNSWQIKTRPTHLLPGHTGYYEFWCSILLNADQVPPSLTLGTHIPIKLPPSSRGWLEQQIPNFKPQLVGTLTTEPPQLQIMENKEGTLDLFAGYVLALRHDAYERLTKDEPAKEDVDAFLLHFLEFFSLLYMAKRAGSNLLYRYRDLQ
jgi:hypothetical protein